MSNDLPSPVNDRTNYTTWKTPCMQSRQDAEYDANLLELQREYKEKFLEDLDRNYVKLYDNMGKQRLEEYILLDLQLNSNSTRIIKLPVFNPVVNVANREVFIRFLVKAFTHLAKSAIMLEQAKGDETQADQEPENYKDDFVTILTDSEMGVYWLLCYVNVILENLDHPLNRNMTEEVYKVLPKLFLLWDQRLRDIRSYKVLRDTSDILELLISTLKQLVDHVPTGTTRGTTTRVELTNHQNSRGNEFFSVKRNIQHGTKQLLTRIKVSVTKICHVQPKDGSLNLRACSRTLLSYSALF
ncbi:hypothetical protein HELRODRAFT_166636 [Helobdella robusta]|uniref:Uncharacterized protein n=1 Tax=Helobdella robusta TaxID=6412 RepID=T1EYB2_HELRO|nr:hypothetical protein HELRODRAFT_166636 [Helobdella robusta]ESO11623.1 hypothetical protein HELRODRAFT_166636 [Helobdella robusta]